MKFTSQVLRPECCGGIEMEVKAMEFWGQSNLQSWKLPRSPSFMAESFLLGWVGSRALSEA
jgi:hypothetical protein